MCLNANPSHQAHRVTAYFELLRTRYPLLYLLRTENNETNQTIQKSATIIKANVPRTTERVILYDLKSQIEKKDKIISRNFETFLKKYPG
jgi:hypothetical protein